MLPYCPAFGNCQRMYFLAKTLNQKYSVHIAHIKNAEFNDFGQEIFFNSILLNTPDLIKKKFLKSNSYSPLQQESNSQINFKVFLKKMINNLFDFFMMEPHRQMGIVGLTSIFSSRKQLVSLIKEKKIKNVIISAPPFALFHSLIFLRKISGLNVIIDYRDPWNFYFKKESFFSKYFEKKYLEMADSITFFGAEIIEDITDFYQISKNKCLKIRNGYSSEMWDNISSNDNFTKNKLIFTHVGGLELSPLGYRNPFPLFEAIKDFSENTFTFNFVGMTNCSENDKQKIKEQFSDKIVLIDYTSSPESLRYMLNSDIVVILHEDPDNNTAKYMYTGKYYDYIRSQKIIMSIGDPDSPVNQEIFHYHLGFVCRNKKDELVKTIARILDLYDKKELYLKPTENFDFSTLSREYQNSQIFQVLK